MAKKQFKTEKIIQILRTHELHKEQGLDVKESCRRLEIAVSTLHRWKKEYGGLRVEQVKKLKELERENAQLKKVVADLALDKSILKEALSGNY